MKIIALSDTHGQHEKIKDVPDGDVLIVAGDVTHDITLHSIITFATWLSKFPHEHKIVIAGNHDGCFTRSSLPELMMKEKGIIYLQDETITINGLIFYGTPWTPNFMNWHFMADEKTLYDIFINIPKRTDVLITHTPAFSQFDKIKQIREIRPSNVGSKSLKIIKETRLDNLKCHIFGHVHESHGNDKMNYNVSVLDEKYRMVNKVTEIEI